MLHPAAALRLRQKAVDAVPLRGQPRIVRHQRNAAVFAGLPAQRVTAGLVVKADVAALGGGAVADVQHLVRAETGGGVHILVAVVGGDGGDAIGRGGTNAGDQLLFLFKAVVRKIERGLEAALFGAVLKAGVKFCVGRVDDVGQHHCKRCAAALPQGFRAGVHGIAKLLCRLLHRKNLRTADVAVAVDDIGNGTVGYPGQTRYIFDRCHVSFPPKEPNKFIIRGKPRCVNNF